MGITTLVRPAVAVAPPGWEIHPHDRLDDTEWDRFIETTPGGHYTQAAAWARFRASFGWRAARATVRRNGSLVAGTQLLIRPIRGVGAIGYVLHGPVVGTPDTEAVELALRALQRLCRQQRVRYLVLRPNDAHDVTSKHLRSLGFRRTDRLDKPFATARVDLSSDPDVILGGMRRSTRTNVRRGLTRGLTARRGSDADLATLLRLYELAAGRKGFSNVSTSRYQELWRQFRSAGRAEIFLVEDQGVPVSAQLALRVGDTLYSHLMAWSGEQAIRKPNELLEWTAMMWAKDSGCRFYDFEGISAATTGDDPEGDAGSAPPGGDAWVSDYKRGFGAHVVPAPQDHDYVVNALLRWGYHATYPRIEHLSLVQRMDRRLQCAMSGRRAHDSVEHR